MDDGQCTTEITPAISLCIKRYVINSKLFLECIPLCLSFSPSLSLPFLLPTLSF